jgi:hypothetical protein
MSRSRNAIEAPPLELEAADVTPEDTAEGGARAAGGGAASASDVIVRRRPGIGTGAGQEREARMELEARTGEAALPFPLAGGADSRPAGTLLVLDPDFSRNRHFDWYESPEGQALRPFRRVIQGLVSDLERVDPEVPIHVEPAEDGRFWIELFIAKFKATRRSCLAQAELEALRSHPRIGPRLTPKPGP